MVLYFFSFALISKRNSDIRIDIFVQMMPKPVQRVFGLLARLLALLFQAIVLWCAIKTVAFVRIFTTPILEVSESIFFVPVIAGAIDILITELVYLRLQAQGRMQPPGAGLAAKRLPV
jgi:TRAP-type C4-dicarboxylate transport system permease small subunit